MKVEVSLTGYPSTGNEWIPSHEPDDVAYASRFPEKDDEGEFFIGGQSFTTFVYNDMPPGTELTFDYRREWEDKEPTEIVHVRVVDTESPHE